MTTHSGLTGVQDFSEWSNQLVIQSEMADYAPVRGCMVVRPSGWALWENISAWLDVEFKKTGRVNAAFPTLIPLSFFEEEEAKIKEETRATTRCIPADQPEGHGSCIYCGRSGTERVYFARAY